MIRKVNYVLLFSTLLLLLVSCGTDSPSGGDDTNPEVKLLMVYNDADTLYNSLDPSAFTPFGKSILPGDHKIKFKASDNESLYKLTLFAEDTITGVKYEIKSISSPTSNDTLITFTYDMFSVV